jgi:hypothetical protein
MEFAAARSWTIGSTRSGIDAPADAGFVRSGRRRSAASG